MIRLAGSYSQRRWLTPRRAAGDRNRRRVPTDGGRRSQGRSAPVTFSEHAVALAALRELHKFAGAVVRPPVAERAAAPAKFEDGR